MTTVIAQPYETEGNGGRKLVRLSNGWLIASVYDSSATIYETTKFYKSVNNGNSWEYIGFSAERVTAISSFGTMVYILYNLNNDRPRFRRFDATQVVGGIGIHTVSSYISSYPDAGQTILGGSSLSIDPTNGHLHAVWASKNATYPNAWNIRYSTSTDGGSTWSAPMQRTGGSAGYDAMNPTIVSYSGNIYIFYNYKSANANQIQVHAFINGTWRSIPIYQGGSSYFPTLPSAVVDRNGAIHVVWQSTSESSTSIQQVMYSKSTDKGLTWTTPVLPYTETKVISNPSITVDSRSNIFISFEYRYSMSDYDIYNYRTSNGLSWVRAGVSTASGMDMNPSTLYDPTFSIMFVGNIPPVIYQRSTNVDYLGTFTLETPPTTPSSISASGNFVVGKTISVAWGSSTDANGDEIFYELESSINNQSFNHISTTTSSSTNYLIPSGTTSISFRVRAVANEQDSPYRTSSTYAVKVNTPPTMPTFINPSSGTVLIGGKTVDIGWSASTDADGDSITYYIFESYYNDTTSKWGAWMGLSNGESRTKTITVSSNRLYTKVKFYVCAIDSNGDSSGNTFSTEYPIHHNYPPTIVLKSEKNENIMQDSQIKIPINASYKFNIVADDLDANDSLEYRVMVKGITKTAYTPIQKNIPVNTVLNNSDLTVGMNKVVITIKDAYEETSLQFDIILDANIPLDSTCLANMRFNGYSKSTISLAELINHIE